MLLDWLKEDFPEIRRDNEWAYGDASGKSLRVARQRVESKAIERRSSYDAALVQSMQQAVAIGGARGYVGYEGFDFGSYDAGALEFTIGERSVFGHDVEDVLEREKLYWANAESADRAGCPLPAWLELQGEDPARIEIVARGRQEALDAGLGVGRSKQAAPVNDAAAEAIQAPGGATR
jgi:hypothetical protein